MQLEIGQYLAYFLIRKGNVVIPGVGSIVLKKESAYFTHGKTKLHPPKIRFEFSDQDVQSSEISEQIALYEMEDLPAIEKEVSTYSQSILNQYLNYEYAEIPQIGFLSKSEGNTHFIPSQTLIAKAYHGFQPVKAEPLRKEFIRPPEVSPALATSPVKKENEWINRLAALLLGALMVIAYHYFVDPLNQSATQSNLKPKSSQPEVRKEIPSPNKEPEEVKLLVPNQQDSVAKQDNLKTNEELAILPKEPTIPPPIILEESPGINIAQPKQDQDCIILIGVYNRTIEALAMMDRIKAKGYKPFRDVQFDVNRVGIQFNCSEKDLKSVLEEVKTAFNNKDAYYLKPNITI